MTSGFSTNMSQPTRRAVALILIAGMGMSVLLAAGASIYASPSPDGLERVAEDTGVADTADESATADSPFADYGVSGLDDQSWSGSVAGLLGVVVTTVIAFGLFRALTRNRRDRSPIDEGPVDG